MSNFRHDPTTPHSSVLRLFGGKYVLRYDYMPGRCVVRILYYGDRILYRVQSNGNYGPSFVRFAIKQFCTCRGCGIARLGYSRCCDCHRHCNACNPGCEWCDSCGNMSTRISSNCICGGDDNEPQWIHRSAPFFHDGKPTKAIPSCRHISTEIEVCGANAYDATHDAVASWHGCIVSDSSLPAGGFEINTAPASGNEFLDQIDDICAALQHDSAFVDDNAGLHVHVSSKSMNIYGLRKLAVLYRQLEPLFFAKWPSREDNSYCREAREYLRHLFIVPFSGANPGQNIRKAIYEKVYRKDASRKREKYDEARYYALNIHSHYFRGTIECRVAPGMIKATPIKLWGTFWACLMDYADNKPDRIVGALSHKTAEEIVAEVCPVPAVHKFLTNS